MKIQTLVVGEISTNCYLVSADKGETLVIDPGDEAPKIIRAIETHNLQPKIIINTHGHPDHTGANLALSQKYNLPIFIHKEDARFLSPATSLLGRLLGYHTQAMPVDKELSDGDEIKVGDLTLKILHTPGHSPGGISILAEGVVFSGDTLFAGDVGRTDLLGGSEQRLWQSIKEKLFILPGPTRVLPGHGPATQIDREKSLYGA